MNQFSSPQLENENLIIPSSDETKHTEGPEKENSFLEIVRFSILALLIVVPVRMFVAQPFLVSGASMEQTFHNGDYLIVDRVSYTLNDPERGDVVIFRYPKDPSKFFIKRIIAIPGDTISIIGSNVTITNAEFPSGYTVSEPYIKSMKAGIAITETLGEREYFVMGDNRDESSDSRVWGVLQEERIVGRAFLRLFPPQSFDVMPGAVVEEATEDINS